MRKFLSTLDHMNFYYAAWLLTVAGLFGSLIYSNYMGLPPCDLCWYQRILLYPQVVIFTVGLALRDKYLPFYIMPLSIMGMLLAFYQVLLQEGVIQESSAFCTNGVSCITDFNYPFLQIFSIPLQSFVAFALITALTYWGYKLSSKSN